MKSFLCLLFVCMITVLTAGIGSAAAADVIQTQESDVLGGFEADLTRVSIRDDILTFRFKIRNSGSESQVVEFYFKDCYIVDASSQKKYFPLKDSEGQFIAGPKEKDWEGGRYHVRVDGGSSAGFWMKFPVPADNPGSVDISVPGFFPFEEIELE